jgi:Fur family transcriptional regulator, ferric uptake regulator
MQHNICSRSTKQRQVILDELRKLCTHPTADEVYEMVRCQLPRISLGTVYRNLEMLAAHGVIQKVDTSGTQRRFDGNPAPHYHIRCMGCGKVDDVPVESIPSIEELVRDVSDYEILGYRLEFRGLCPQCQCCARQGSEDFDRRSPDSRHPDATTPATPVG